MNLSKPTLTCALLFLGAIQPLHAEEAMSVDGKEVTRDEFVWFAHQERTGVIQFFNQKYGGGVGAGFWARDFHGTTPRAELKRRTIARVTREKIQQALFAELCLVTNFTHATFLENLERMNHERSDAVRRGEVIYGPTTFAAEQFYRHWLASMQIHAKEILAQSRLAATEQQLKQYFVKNKKLFYAPARSSWEFTKVSKGQTNLTNRLADITDERFAECVGDEALVMELKSLRAGRILTEHLADGTTLIAKCVNRKPATRLLFEEAKPRVASRLLDERYEKLIAERTGRAEVRLKGQEMDGINFE